MRKSLILSALLCATSITPAALAQNAPLPPFLDRQKEIMTFEGSLGGLEIWSMDGYDGVWAISPDGKMAIAGAVFGATGKDMGALLANKDPITDFATEYANAIAAAEGQAAGTADLDLTAIGSRVSEIEAAIANAEAQAAPRATPVPANLPPKIDLALKGFSENDRQLLLAALIKMLNTVKSEDEFRRVVLAWTEEVARRAIAIEQAERGAGDQASSIGADDAPVSVDVTKPLIEPAATDAAEPTPAGQAEAAPAAAAGEPDETAAEQLLDDVRTGAFWFSLGTSGAPVAYAFIDPTCPYCGRTLVNLKPMIDSGKLELRIMLAPVVSAAAPAVITSILQSDKPREAFMKNALARGEGRVSDLVPGDFSTLAPEFKAGLERNVTILQKYGIKGVPFLVFDTEIGAHVVNGVPTEASLELAIPDAFMGDSGKPTDN